MEAQSLSAIYARLVRRAYIVTRPFLTSRALKMTYSLMVSCPRMEWYILLASVKGTSMNIERTTSSIRRMSAFCDGGSGFLLLVMKFTKTRQTASTKRIGCTVNVYKNESKQSTKPKRICCEDCVSVRFYDWHRAHSRLAVARPAVLIAEHHFEFANTQMLCILI